MSKPRSVIARMAAMVLAAALLPTPNRATDIPLVGDAHVIPDFPTINFGSISNLYVGNGSWALVQFDLTALPTGTTASQVARANLRLYVNRVNTPGAMDLHAIQAAWNESTVTYSNAPAIGATLATVPITTANTFIDIDVTQVVQGWITTPSSNFGFAIAPAVTEAG